MFKNIELGNNQDEVWLFGDKVLYLRQITNRTHTQRCIMAKQLYIDFDEYIRQGEPSQCEKAAIWSTAIGLQAVDGLTTSEYLQKAARRNIEGEISVDEVKELINNYYITKTAHNDDDAGKEEADRVSSNIAKLLSSSTLNFSVLGYTLVHKNLFSGVFCHPLSSLAGIQC